MANSRKMKRRRKRSPQRVTIDRGLKLVGISDVVVSPDGELAAYVRSTVRKNEKTRGTSIWAVSSYAAKLRQLTQGPEDAQPRWSPDGFALAFTRKLDKDKPPQVFLLPRHGGEPTKLTDLEIAPEALSFSPNGKRLAFLAQTPDDKQTKARQKRGDDARLFVEDDKPKRLWIASLKSGKAKAASPEDRALWQYDWLPDGNAVAVLYTEEPRLDALYFRPRIGLVQLKEANLRPLDVTFRFAQGIRVSPDGRHIALVAGMTDAPGGGEAWTVDLQTSATTCLTPDLGATVERVEWLPDSARLLLMVSEGVVSRLHTVNLNAPGKLEAVCEALRKPGLPAAARAMAGGS